MRALRRGVQIFRPAVMAAALGFNVALPVTLPAAAGPTGAGPAATAPGALAEQGTTFTTPGGATLWYEVRGPGSARPLVVANGGPGFDHTYLHCSDAWDRLAAGRRVIFYDQRGNGRSVALKEGQSCTVADQIADLEALRVHLGFETIDLLGHSWGGYLVMAYAARHPDRIAHLLIVDSAAPRIQDTAFLFKQIFPETTDRQDGMAFAVELGDPEAIASDLHEYMTMLFVSSAARDAMLARTPSFAYSQAVNKAVWTDAQRFDLNPELPKFTFPTLVITGRYDFNVAPSIAWAIHRAIPGSEFAVFEKSGHLPYCEEPDAFVQRVESFLGKK